MKRIVCAVLSLLMLSSAALCEDIAYDKLTLEELNKIIESADQAINRYHTVSYALSTKLARMTRDLVGSRLTDGTVDWDNADWVYEREWDELTVYAVAGITKNGVTAPCDVNASFIEDGDTYLPVLLVIDDQTLLDTRADEEYLNGYDDADDGENADDQPTVVFIDDLASEDDAEEADADENEPNGDLEPSVSPEDGEMPEPTPETQTQSETASTPEPTPEPTPEAAPSQDVIVAKQSSRGDAVKQIQVWLNDLGYLKETADGIYGKNTTEAVKKFQSDNGIDITGDVSEALFAILRDKVNADKPIEVPEQSPSPNDTVIIAQSGSKGDLAKDIQMRLIKLGYLNGVADGRYGEQTSRAVSNLQRAMGVNETGKVTQGLYNSMLALTRRASIVGFDSFLMIFNEVEKQGSVNVELKSPELPAAGGTVTYKLDQYTTVVIVVDEHRAVKSVTINGAPDGFAEGDLSILNGYQSALVACGAVTGPLEGRRFLEEVGAYKDALKESGEGEKIIDDIKYVWKAADGAVSLTITVEI